MGLHVLYVPVKYFSKLKNPKIKNCNHPTCWYVWYSSNNVALSHLFICPPPQKKKKNWEELHYCTSCLTINERYKNNKSTLCHFHLPSFNKWIRFLRMTFAFSYFDGPATAISASCSIICLFLYSCSSNAALYASTVWAASLRRRNWASY